MPAPSFATCSGTVYREVPTATSGAPILATEGYLVITPVTITGNLIWAHSQRVDANSSGVVSFIAIQNSTVNIRGNVIGYNAASGINVVIPASSTASLEDLTTVANVAVNGLTVYNQGSALIGLYGTLKVTGAGITAAQESSGVFTVTVPGGAGLPVADTQTLVKGSADATKLLKFEVDGFTPATTRVATWPDKDGTVAMLSDITAGLGTVTSVALSVPSFLSVTGSPVTTSGTLAVSLATQSPNLVFAGPTTGSPAAPTFRSLVTTDIPDLSNLYQPLDGDLTALAGVTSAADKVPYFTGSATAAVFTCTSAGRAILDDVDAAAQRTTLGLGTLATQSGTFSGTSSGTNTGDQSAASLSLVIGTNTQAWDADLDALAGLTTAADKLPYFTGSHAASLADFTSFGRSLVDDADASMARTTLGLGALATQSGTFSGTSSGTNTGDQTITLTGDVTGSGAGSFAATIGAGKVTNTMLAGSIAYSKLSLIGAILNADLAGSIVYSKLSLTGAILNADLAGSIAISKLSITGTPDGTKFLRDDGSWQSAGGGLTVGTTTITSGANTKVLFNNSGVVGEYTITGTGNVVMSAGPTLTGTVGLAALTATGTIVQTSASATAFESGPNGSTNPVLRLVNSTASQADGISITGLAAGSGVTFQALSSGATAPINITPKGNANINLNIPVGSNGGVQFGSQVGFVYYANNVMGLYAGVGITAAKIGFKATGMGFLDATQLLKWHVGSGDFTGAADLGLGYNASAIAEFNTGTAGRWAGVKAGFYGAATNSVANGVTIGTRSTGTPAAGLGGALLFNIDSSTTIDQTAGQYAVLWTDATHATRTADHVFYNVNSAAGLAEKFRVKANGNAIAQGDLVAAIAGKGLQLQSGTGARAGEATLVGGTVTVTNTTVGASTFVYLQRRVSGGTIGMALTYTKSNGASFTINSDNVLDTSTVSYLLIEVN